MTSGNKLGTDDHGYHLEDSVKILLLGDSDCGKTCLIRAFYEVNKMAPPFSHYSALVFPCYIGVHPEKVKVLLYDVHASEDFNLIRKQCFEKIEVFIFCYGINDCDSFKNLEHKWIPRFKSYFINAGSVLVGTKADRRDQAHHSDMDYMLTSEEGLNLKIRHSLNSFVECSSTEIEKVIEVFTNAVSLKRSNN